MRRILAVAVIAQLMLLLAAGCGHPVRDERLLRIDRLASADPDSACRAIAKIVRDSLGDSDRHFYDLLTIKTADKAYVTHTSDSLILDVIDYYSRHPADSLYAEALYYGGRVYSDIGDYPTALTYFQKAINLLPPETDYRYLRSIVHSQTGRLLDNLRLYDEAIPYIETSLDIEKHHKDTTNIVYDLQLLGGTYLRAKNYHLADSCLRESLKLCTADTLSLLTPISESYLADVIYKTGDLDSALKVIRKAIATAEPDTRISAIAYASNMYLDAGILDTAYMYSRELITNPYLIDYEIGYQNLLDPRLRKFIDPDSLDIFINNYRGLLESFYDENQSQLAINQQSFYNYQLHERKKAEVEKYNSNLKLWVALLLLMLALTGCIILFITNKYNKRIIDLQLALQTIKERKQAIELSSANSDKRVNTESNGNAANQKEVTVEKPTEQSPQKRAEELRKNLRDELLSLYEKSDKRVVVPETILQSEPYRILLDLLKEGRPIKDNLWNDLRQVVSESSPSLKKNLELLSSGNITTTDIETVVLIKCGMKPSQMTTLLAKSNGAVISRREKLCVKVMGKKLGVAVIDSIIRLL